MLGSNFDEFLAGTGAVVDDAQLPEAFRADPDALLESLDCHIQDGDNRVRFEVKVMHNDANEVTIRELSISNDLPLGSETGNLVSINLGFLGECSIDENFTQLPEAVVNRATFYDNQYELKLNAKAGGTYEILVRARPPFGEKSSEMYHINYIQISSVPY